MLGGFNVVESEPVFDLGTKYLLQQDDPITLWKNLGDYFSKDKAMQELIQLQNFNPQVRYRIVRNSGDKIEVVFDTSTDRSVTRNLGKISNLMGGI